ncbi:hypothetical protein E2C01_038083 [Portunus trituberculatus]|uniref:Uncharacterized protein n=1 Tax=Portunus trituberculatus TaxID=210409 RepID=A0A5B7F9W3_PORTR|nr:hypothetical protein [Portunus trituberculatus]
MRNFKGHKMKIVSVSHFPYVDYTLDTDLPGSIVTLKDSVDARLIISLSEKLNFTSEVILISVMLSQDALPSNMKFCLYVSALTQPFLQRQLDPSYSTSRLPPPGNGQRYGIL